MKIIIYIAVFFILSPLISSGQRQILQSPCARFIGHCNCVKEGRITKDFWNCFPILPERTESITVIQDPKIWNLIQAVPAKYRFQKEDSSEENEDSGSTVDPQITSAINKLKSLGFLFFDKYQITWTQGNKKTFIWILEDPSKGRHYLIGTKEPFPLCNDDGGPDQTLLLKIEPLKNDVYRMFIENHYNNGSMADETFLYICNINLTDNSMTDWMASEFLNPKDTNLVVSEAPIEYFVNWSWIYKWDGKGWVNVSDQYPDYYKTKVHEYLMGFDTSGLKDMDEVLQIRGEVIDVFREAAAKGGPAAFK